MSVIREKRLKSDGFSIPYIWNVNEKSRMIMLCLHGFGGDKDSSVIAALMKSMEEKGIGVVTFDWPAHGESDAPDQFLTVENCLNDLDIMLTWIKKRSDLPVACFATSFGGYLATLYRNEHPEVFEYLILRSPALKMKEVFRSILSDSEFEKLTRGEGIVQGYERKMIIEKDFYESLCRHDAYSIKPPDPEKVFIIQGDKDDVVDPEDTMAYALLNGIEICVFEGTDHLYKKPGEKERIVQVTEQFLKDRNEPE